MTFRPENSLNRFYKQLKLNKEIHEIITFFRKWRKEAHKELNKRIQR